MVEAKRAYARTVLDIAARLQALYLSSTTETSAIVARFDTEWPHCRTVFAWAKDAIDSDATALEICCHLPRATAQFLFVRINPEERIEWFTAGAAAASQAKEPRIRAAHVGNRGLAHADLAQWDAALACHEEVLAYARDSHDDTLAASAHGNIAIVLKESGRPREAMRHQRRSLRLKRDISIRTGQSDARGIANSLNNLANVCLALGKFRSAFILGSAALRLRRAMHDTRGQGTAIGNIGEALAGMGRLTEAVRSFRDYRRLARAVGDARGEAIALMNLGDTALRREQPRRALVFFERGLQRSAAARDRLGRARALAGRARALSGLGQWEEAVAQGRVALEEYALLAPAEGLPLRSELGRWQRRARRAQRRKRCRTLPNAQSPPY